MKGNKNMLQSFQLGADFAPTAVDGELLKTLQHESVQGAYTYHFKTSRGPLQCTVSRGTLWEVSYQLNSLFPWVRAKMSQQLLQSYATDGQWKAVYQDKSGKMYHSQQEYFYAAIGQGNKYMNIGSMAFHEEKYRIVS